MKGAECDETVPRESLPMKPEGGRLPPTKVIKRKLSNVPKVSESQNGKGTTVSSSLLGVS